MTILVETPSRGEETRTALLAAALDMLGERGFVATSTREIAARARVNVAMIAYHFGGKEGLRSACAEYVALRLRKLFAAAGAAVPETPQAARAALVALVRAMILGLVVDEAARPLARFVLREMSDASPAFARVFESAFAPLHIHACRLWGRAAGVEPESEEAKLSVFTTIAQIVYFRIARPPVLLRMSWRDIGAAEAAALEAVVLRNLEAALDAAGRRP